MPQWEETEGPDLAQGDLLTGVLDPIDGEDFPTALSGHPLVSVDEVDGLIATQSCDLANAKIQFAILVKAMPIAEFERANPHYSTRKNWNLVIHGGVHALHLLPAPDNSQSSEGAWVVDFREVYSLPVPYLQRHATGLGKRGRLCSPYLEHFSQSFGRFFMRVALPEPMREFK